jgi:transmembrane sensor
MMSNIIELADHSTPHQQASAWLAKMDRGLNADEEAQLQLWLAARPENAQTLVALSECWDRMNVLSRLAEIFPESDFQPVARRRFPALPLAAAAVLLAGLLVGGWAMLQTLAPVPLPVAQQTTGEKRFETGTGEHSTVILPDGSQLVLNTDTLVHWVYTPTERHVYLERGEVNIQVAHLTDIPFIAHAGDRQVRAVGTAFNLQITPSQEVELIVTEGKVLVGRQVQNPVRADQVIAKPAPLVAGQRILLSDAEQKVSTMNADDIRAKLSWRNGSLVFRGESLEEAITEIERYTPVEFVILDEDLKHIRVAGLFRTGDVDGLLATLKENFNVSSQRVNAEKVILTKE